jgi:hypothetical protein
MAPQSTISATGNPRRRLGVWLIAVVVAAGCSPGSGPGSTATNQPTVVPSATTSAASSTTAGPIASTAPPSRPPVPVPTFVDASGFNDHTVPQVNSVDEFFALARPGVAGQQAVKFTISDMAGSPRISWMDSNFYSLHDEWYWFRLLNGSAVPGAGTAPVAGPRFETIQQIYEWAAAQPRLSLPLDLAFVGGQAGGDRLYSDEFYDLSLQDPRVFGPGTVAYFPTSTSGAARWVLELEYHDVPEPAEVAMFFELIAASLPEEISGQLEWVVRSPEQATVAAAMAAGSLLFHDRIITYRDLVEPGTVAVYNEGIAAGRLLLIGEGGKGLGDARDNDILLVENVPDFLPPGRALISSAPQTPLAHVNLLARNRGIPNASQAGILQDPAIQQAARVRAHAIVRASAADGLEVVLITAAEYEEWLQLNELSPLAVPGVDPGSAASVIALDEVAAADEGAIARLRPLIGGKAAGFLTLRLPASINLPEPQVVVTTAPYFAHLASIRLFLDATLDNPDFQISARIRLLVLEGADTYSEFYPDPVDRAFAEDFFRRNPPGTPLGEILGAGGFRELLRREPIAPETLEEITSELQVHFGSLHPAQGLRFRSSSSVEDIEGFNGAGLYDSNTGFFRPDIQVDEDDHKKSIEWAVKATWASYWGFEAFEERRTAGIDHRSGGMAVLVHPRFDDAHELANGVLTFTILPAGASHPYSMVLNVQAGAVSVANPDPSLGALPEVITVTSNESGGIDIEWQAPSNLVSPGERVLSDAQVEELYRQARTVTLAWRYRVNAALAPAQRIETLTLDFEFKHMAAGWPQYRGDVSIPERPARLVFKQARTLEPGLRQVPLEVRQLPIRRDVLARARLVERVRCEVATAAGAETASSVIEVLTDPLLVPDVGFATEPYVVVEDGPDPGPGTGGDNCTRTLLYSTPDQFLYELLADGELLNLSR